MALNLQEQDEVESLKAFWGKYGNFLMATLTVVLLAIAGWRGWNYWEARQSAEAAALYDALRAAANAKDVAKVKETSGNLFERFGNTAYGQMAALLAARVYFDANDLKAAKPPLEWAAGKARDEEFRVTARLRLASILIDEKAFEEAARQLAGPVPKAFAGEFADVRGDLLVAQNKLADAKAAYKQALEALVETSPVRPLVKIKLDALSSAGA